MTGLMTVMRRVIRVMMIMKSKLSNDVKSSGDEVVKMSIIMTVLV